MDSASIVRVAGLIGEAGRIRMLTALLDGRQHSASDLSLSAGVSAQTASAHLAKLVNGELLLCERRGRQRLFRLKSADVAAAIEALAALAPAAPAAISEFRYARTCYDHLAGVLSIAVRDALLRKKMFRVDGAEFDLTSQGEKFLSDLGIEVRSLRRLRRAFVRSCLDVTERHHHIGGAAGAALLSRFFELRWLAPTRTGRAVRITGEGERQFERVFGIRCAALRLTTPPPSR